MSELDAIAAALAARVAPGMTGTLLTFRVDDTWLTMTARTAPHLELSMPAPELAGLRLRLQLGAPTLVGAAGRDDQWAVRSSDRAWAGRLLAEAPWPTASTPRWKVVVAFAGLLVSVIAMIWFERKLHADFSNRLGPRVAGPFGTLQTIADGMKLLFKEIIVPSGASKGLFILGPILAIAPSLAAWAVVPFDDGLVLALTRLLYSDEVDDSVDDLLISRGPRLHLLQRTPRDGVHLYMELDRAGSNLGLARSRLQAIVRRVTR